MTSKLEYFERTMTLVAKEIFGDQIRAEKQEPPAMHDMDDDRAYEVGGKNLVARDLIALAANHHPNLASAAEAAVASATSFDHCSGRFVLCPQRVQLADNGNASRPQPDQSHTPATKQTVRLCRQALGQ